MACGENVRHIVRSLPRYGHARPVQFAILLGEFRDLKGLARGVASSFDRPPIKEVPPLRLLTTIAIARADQVVAIDGRILQAARCSILPANLDAADGVEAAKTEVSGSGVL